MKIARAISAAVGCAILLAPGALAADIDTIRTLVNKGNYLMAAGHFNDALKTYEQAQKYEPGNAVIKNNIARLYNNWGIYFWKQHNWREAQGMLEKSLATDPSYGQARTNMSILKRSAFDEGIDLDAPPQEDPKPEANYPKLPEGGDLVPKKPAVSGAAVITPGAQPAPTPLASPPAATAAAATTPPTTAASVGAVLAPKEAPIAPEQPQAGAVLFIGGVKQQPSATQVDSYPIGATSAPAADASPMVTPVVSTPPAAVAPATTVAPSATVGSGNDYTAKPINPMYPVTPRQFPDQPVSPFATWPPSRTAAPSAVPVVSFDEQLAAVEMKVYGAKQANLTVLQRLEKIEVDSTGQVRSGTILDRINALKKSYGLP